MPKATAGVLGGAALERRLVPSGRKPAYVVIAALVDRDAVFGRSAVAGLAL